MPTCSRCGKMKPPATFDRDKRSSSGLRSSCKPCRRIYEKGMGTPASAEAKAAAAKRYRENPANQKKIRARYILNNAIKAGKTARPAVCPKCGQEDGRRVEAHHPDYSKPLEVEWACKECHSMLHFGHPS